ncbi:MAG: hypothetical protein Q7S21_03190 [archaeon]|nr:hypothetical protein [archaeon]
MNKNTIVLLGLIALGIVLFGCTQQQPLINNTVNPPAYEPPINNETPTGFATDLDQDITAFDSSVSGLDDSVEPTPDFPTDASEFQ